MSNQQLDRFLVRLAKDEFLRLESGKEHVSPVQIVALAARHGLQFTSEDLLSEAAPLTDDEWAEATRMFDGDHSDSYILFLEEVPMSKEALGAFFKKVVDDEGLQKKLVEFAVAQGFEFSADELSDADLDSVAGGLLRMQPLSSTNLKVENVTFPKVENLKDI